MNLRTFLGACLLTALLAVPAVAETPPRAPAEEGGALQAVVVSRDAETGELGVPGHASLEEIAALDPSDKASAEDLRELLADRLSKLESTYGLSAETKAVRRTDGVEELRLGLDRLSFSIVRSGGVSSKSAPPTVDVFVDDEVLQGANAEGHLLLYAPQPFRPGSSISHFDPSALPNLLMEPAINSDLLPLDLDVTPGLMEDIGWPIVEGDEMPVGFRILAADDGFADPRPFTPVPGNDATTLGDARLNAFEGVLEAWSSVLSSEQEVDVLVFFTPLPCSPAGAALAAAGPVTVFADFPGAEKLGTWYPGALAEAVSGENLSGDPVTDPDAAVDMVVLVNSEIDNGCLGPGTSFYYGLDGDEPPTQVDFAPTVLHELGHGLGFTVLTNGQTGERIGPPALPSIWEHYVHDDVAGELWLDMDDAERRESAQNSRFLSWHGPAATAAAEPFLAGGSARIAVDAETLAGTFPAQPAFFGPALEVAPFSGEVACIEDGLEDPTVLNGCSDLANGDELAGKVALVDRGQCQFTTKVIHAQRAGAIGVIVVNNAGNSLPPMGGSSAAITIPSVGVSHDVGNALRRAACPEKAAFVGDEDRFQVTVSWETPKGETGPGEAVPITDGSAGFYFFGKENLEVTVKVLDACRLDPFNNFWAFAGGMTDVGVTITVNDTRTGETRVYENPVGEPFVAIRDTAAFDTCP